MIKITFIFLLFCFIIDYSNTTNTIFIDQTKNNGESKALTLSNMRHHSNLIIVTMY